MMDLYRVTHLLVFDRRRLVGVVCACDLRDAPAQETVAKYMSSPPMVVLPTAPIEAAATMCEEARIGCLPVVAGARVVGIVTRGDLRRAGVLDVDATPCQCCGTTRHVRPDPETGMYKCTDCRHPEERPDEWADLGVGD
jgi:signal-transduction protein with cAMP-binding, CBS, and nucleotidyltransferase domain